MSIWTARAFWTMSEHIVDGTLSCMCCKALWLLEVIWDRLFETCALSDPPNR